MDTQRFGSAPRAGAYFLAPILPDPELLVFGAGYISTFEAAFETLGVSSSAYIVIVTRGHAFDQRVLEQALGTPAACTGMLGSAAKRDKIFAALTAQGFTDQDLGRVHAPIGLPIGAETPAEIAVSIVGELIRVRAGRP